MRLARASLVLVATSCVAVGASCAPAEAPGSRSLPAPTASAAAPSPVALGCPSKIAHHAAVAEPAPPNGWVLVPTPAVGSETLACANLSRNEWRVGAPSGAADIALRDPAGAGDPLPVVFSPAGRVAGQRRVLAVDGGFLVGWEGGAGAALYFVSGAGGASRLLAPGAVVGFASLRTGIVAVVERSHGGLRAATALHVARDGDGAWNATAWVSFGGGVEAVATESSESLLVLSTTGLDRLTACGDVTRLGPTNYDVLYPSSLAVDPAGVIYVGMRHFVTRWIPEAGGAYREEWLTKQGCALLSAKKFECVCRG